MADWLNDLARRCVCASRLDAPYTPWEISGSSDCAKKARQKEAGAGTKTRPATKRLAGAGVPASTPRRAALFHAHPEVPRERSCRHTTGDTVDYCIMTRDLNKRQPVFLTVFADFGMLEFRL